MSRVNHVSTRTSVITGVSLLLALACRAERAPLPAKPAASAGPTIASTPVPPMPPPVSSAGVALDWQRLVGIEAGGACKPSDAQDWYLRLDLLKPTKQHRVALVARRNTLPGALLCGKGGEIYLQLSTLQVRQLLAEHASLLGAMGAGNSLGTCGWFASISPPHFVPQQLVRDVAALAFDTDPKFELTNDAEPCAAP